MIPTLETERLLLRSVVISDAPFFFILWNSKDWLKYIGDRNIKAVQDAEKVIKEKYFTQYRENGYGSYIVIEKESNQPIGSCGLFKREALAHPDIGFAFLPAYYNKGYGYESSKAVMDFAAETLQLKTIYGITLPTNKISIRLLEKLGLKEKGTYTFPDGAETLLLFST